MKRLYEIKQSISETSGCSCHTFYLFSFNFPHVNNSVDLRTVCCFIECFLFKSILLSRYWVDVEDCCLEALLIQYKQLLLPFIDYFQACAVDNFFFFCAINERVCANTIFQ